jgi:pimeloyl-ACP methyl ester carboxylesterase
VANLEEITAQTQAFGTLTALGAGRGESVLLVLHGIGGNAGGWTEQLLAFAPHHRTIAWNAPGYCGSSPIAAPKPALRDYADAVVALLDALHIAGPVDVLGHSLGGLVASLVAALFPARVRRLVLADCSSGHRSYPKEDRERLLKSRLAFDESDPVAYARGRVANLLSANASPVLVERAVATLAKLRQPGFGHATRMVSEADIFDHAPRIAAPTRVLCGTEDRVTPEALNRRIAEAIDGAEYVSIPGAGHWSFLERPVEFNHAVLEFLTGGARDAARAAARAARA